MNRTPVARACEAMTIHSSLWNGTDFTQKIRPGPPVSRLLPVQSPNTPAFRANPYPEVTDPICRLPLPTLFYRPEAIHLGDLLRIWVRTGANRCNPHSDFQGPTGHSWTQRELLCSWLNQNPFSPQRNSRASAAYAEKTTLPRAPAGVSESFHVAMLGTRAQTVTLPGWGIWTSFPFGCRCEFFYE